MISVHETATEVSKSITILQAIHWISEAWKTVDSTVVPKCFRKSGKSGKSGILDKEFNVVQEFNLHEDPFSDLDDEQSASAQEGNDPKLLDLMQETCGETTSHLKILVQMKYQLVLI